MHVTNVTHTLSRNSRYRRTLAIANVCSFLFVSSSCFGGELSKQYQWLFPPVSGQYSNAYYTAAKAALIQSGTLGRIDSLEDNVSLLAKKSCSTYVGDTTCGIIVYSASSIARKEVAFRLSAKRSPLGVDQVFTVQPQAASVGFSIPFPGNN